MRRLIKSDIITEVCRDTCQPRYVVEAIINSTINNITLALSKGSEVQFAGFGTFEPKSRAPRIGRNPRTNEAVPIPARVIPSFKAGKDLKKAVTKIQ